ncbi:MAG: DUF4040 domain-containing protein [Thermomicrobiales bacterium]|nr:DUF4040 domain-containing protein [Thermomicrobiales bacterium]
MAGPTLVAFVARWRVSFAPLLATAVAALTFVLSLALWLAGGAALDAPWAPSLGVRLAFRFDGLAALYAMLASGIGALTIAYATRYIPDHLRHQHRPPRAGAIFWPLMTGFMGAMIWLAAAQDLLLLFVCWDATAIASYFLIGFDRERGVAQRAALMALLITGVSAICFLVGALMVRAATGTLDVTLAAERIEPGAFSTVAVALIAVAALAKSAQVPLHFWLPRAMAAPTPVSAYLHSAAMVAAGVYLLARIYPLFLAAPAVQGALVVVGFASMAVGSVLALGSDEFKRLLAYSTIAQYGYVVVMLGLGGAAGLAGAAFYVVAHAIAKSGLFLTAGVVTEATGETRISKVGGLGRPLWLLAAASGLCAAALAALPPTVGFFKDELFFKTALTGGSLTTALALAGAMCTFAYTARFWIGIFLGPRRARPIAWTSSVLVAPIVVLGVLALVGGVVFGPLRSLAEAAGAVSAGEPTPIALGYHLDARPENLLALATWIGGAVLAVGVMRGSAAIGAFGAALGQFGPERAYDAALSGINALSDAIHDFEVRDLRSRIATILLPAGVLVLLNFWVTPNQGAFDPGRILWSDVPLLLILAVAAAAAVATAVPRDHLSMALLLSGVGYSLTVVYALISAPDVALVSVLIETLFALLFLGILGALPRSLLQRLAMQISTSERKRRDAIVAAITGLAAFTVCWGVLSKPAPLETAAAAQIALTPSAHAKDIVTAILADFRGLDTMGEISVLGVAALGLIALLGRRDAR